MIWIRPWMMLVECLSLTSCSSEPNQSAPRDSDRVRMPYLGAREFAELVSSSQSPLLVEFSVPAGCHRCDQMHGQHVEVLANMEGEVDFYRLNFNLERDLVAQLGIEVCPTYVAFDQGKEVFRMAYPTSGEMLAAKLEEIASTP